MTEIKQMLFSKNGYVTYILAREFLKYKVGDRIPTITEWCEKLNIARGTMQNALKSLVRNKAIRIDTKGHVGSYLVQKDVEILLKLAGISSIVGVMPLPYSKRYEGLASGLLVTMENHYNIPVSMAFMRGSKNRVSMLKSNRYDFAILSSLAAKRMIEKGVNIKIVMLFGPNTYLSEHVIIFHDKRVRSIADGMKIGLDFDSLDQKELTEKACCGKKIEYINIEYSQIIEHVLNGDIDAAIWNKDEIMDKYIHINYQPLPKNGDVASEAALVCDENHLEIATLLKEIIDPEVVINIQKLVLEGKITPSY